VLRLCVPNAVAFERNLREADLPVIARIERDEVVLDLRTVADDEETCLLSALRAAFERCTPAESA
jgi:seryl-tRNA(Sec) selenium transferase